MSKTIKLTTPFTSQDIENLKIGDKVLLSGTIFTARDAAHKRIVEAIENGQPLPFDLEGQVIYFVGPAPAKPGEIIGSAGPTTSYRMDSYSPTLLDHGLKGMIGKGARNQDVKDSIVKNKAIYFAAVGGAAVVTAQCVKSVEIIAYNDLGTEAVRRLVVENLPLFVGIDTSGNDLYNR